MLQQNTTQVTIESIPADLKGRKQWVLWRYEQIDRNQKPKKVPIDPRTDRRASISDPTTWADFNTTCAALEHGEYHGMGFVFTKNDRYCGIDLDNCRNPETGVIEPSAQEVIKKISSYTEISPSGRGLHIIAKAQLPDGCRKADRIEMYDHARYFTFTGDHVASTPRQIHNRQREIDALHRQLFGSTKRTERQSSGASTLTDDEVLHQSRHASNSDKFHRLYAGDWSQLYASQSQADLALCSILAYWTHGNADQIDRIFRTSGLFRDKWDVKHFSDGRTYGEGTIDTALQSMAAVYASPAEQLAENRPWPELDEAAYYGLAGDIVRTLKPHTEADPVALFAHLLSEYSAIIGRSCTVLLDDHHSSLALYVVVVGQTSKARKGTAEKRIKKFVKQSIAEWLRGQYAGNLSSGEGLVYAVRDPIGEDPGVSDKRLYLVQPEFGSTLNIMARPGNSLSGVIRDAWDGEDLAPMTKNNRIMATRPHIVIAGHVTIEELKRELTTTQACNGFGNRFAWLLVRRSQTLPFPSKPSEDELLPLYRGLREAVQFSAPSRTLRMTDKAKEAWEEVYEALSDGKPGMVGALLGRAEAHVMRLAGLYALLDKSASIKRVHLTAALALWQYAEDSVQYIFGEMSGDWIADRILDEIRQRGSLTDSAISQLFKRNVSADRLNKAKQSLQERRLIKFGKDKSTGGRSSQVWTLASLPD